MNMNNKSRYPGPNPMQQQQFNNPRQHYGGHGGPPHPPPQGAAGSAPRNPNAPPPHVRVQNGPPRQPQPGPPQQGGQVQVHNQPHGNMQGVPSQHPHPQAPQQGQTQQHPPQQQQQQIPASFAQFQQMGGQQFFVTPAGYPFAAHHNATAFMYAAAAGGQQRPYMHQPGQQGGYPQFYIQAPIQYSPQQHPNQPQMVPQHGPGGQHGYYQGYIPPTRLPVHNTTVPTAVQGPPVHHQQQQGHPHPQTSQHSHHIPNVPQSSNTSAQMTNRQDGPTAVASERKKKILKIVDPNTGAIVIGDSDTNSSSTTESKEVAETPAEGNGDVVPVASPRDAQSPIEVSAKEPSPSETEKQPDQAPVTVKVVVDDQGPESKSKAKVDFYRKITQASDDGAGGQGAVTNPTSPTPAATAPEQPVSPPIDSSKSQQAATTPTAAANTSSDDSKDASLVSVSPVPLEAYLTPRKSPPGHDDTTRSFDEEPEDSQHEDESLSTTVETKDDVSPTHEEIPPVSGKEPVAEAESVVSEIQKDESIDESLAVSEKSEPEGPTESPSEEPVSVAHRNGEVDLEEGELPLDDEENEEGSGADETSGQEGEASDTTDKEQPRKIKYDRDSLLSISRSLPATKPPLSGVIPPDLAKDSSMRSHMAKSPGGGPRGDQFSRMGRPGQGPKPPMGMMNMGGYAGRPGHGGGMMGHWPPMMIPPRPPPPKIIELNKEEVKLHKAENAWKPAAIKHRKGDGDGKDPEEAFTDDIVKATRGILNKLTPENFEKLTKKFMDLKLEDKEERISKVIKVVFEKAVDEPSFSKQYATMVQTVCTKSQETSKKFRKQILDQCQQEFQKNTTDETKIKDFEQQILEATEEDKKERLKAELEDMKFQSRRRSLGNIRFIGELYKLQMLTPKIMVECVNMLLNNPEDEENLECLAKLLTTVGEKLEGNLKDIEKKVHMIKTAKPKNEDEPLKLPNFVPEDNWMAKTFNILKRLSETKKLSSRIRFAMLDVYELREHNWQPRRDANAPKKLEEVHREALRQEMEEKRQISNLPPPSYDQRGSSRMGPPPAKKGEWATQKSTSSRFQQLKTKDQQSAQPVLAPSIPAWASRPGPARPALQPNLPPRLAAAQVNRFQSLAEDRDSKDRLNSNQPYNARDSPGPPSLQSYSSKISPAPSSTSSRENSRPVSPKEAAPPNNECTANINETVKNIFAEYCNVGNTADTLHWIALRFAGDRIIDFVDELSRQVAEISDMKQQHKAGSLLRSLMKSNEINLSKDNVLSTLSAGVIAEIPGIILDCPKVVEYLAQCLVEAFHDDRSLEWLLALEEGLKNNEEEDYQSTWEDLCITVLTILRGKTNEENVRSMYKSTKENDRIPLQGLPWLCPDPESVAQEMVPVLKNHVNSNDSKEEIRQALKEHSWDLREDLVCLSLVEAMCIITWTPERRQWDETILNKLIPVLPSNPKLFPSLWKRVGNFMDRHNVEKDQSDAIWKLLYVGDIACAEPPSD